MYFEKPIGTKKHKFNPYHQTKDFAWKKKNQLDLIWISIPNLWLGHDTVNSIERKLNKTKKLHLSNNSIFKGETEKNKWKKATIKKIWFNQLTLQSRAQD